MSLEVFYTIGFTVSIVVIITGLTICFLTLFIIVRHRRYRTVYHLMTADLCVAMLLYFILCLTRSFYGLHEDWHSHQPGCVYRAYLGMVMSAACIYSFSIQAISRLFFAVFYTRRSLLTWRTHWLLIVVKWLTCFLISCQPLLYEDGFLLVDDFRICGNSLTLPVALYSNVVLFIAPLSVIIGVYTVILYHIRRSTQRVAPNTVNNSTANAFPVAQRKRNLKLMKNILVLISIFCAGGLLHMIVFLWRRTAPSSSPKYLFFLSLNSVIVSATIMIIILFFREKEMKKIVVEYLTKLLSTTNS